MQPMTKKTTILFPPKMYRQLEQAAKKQGTSVAYLVREAVIQRYLLPDRTARLQALKTLTSMEAPVSDWPRMEREILEGRLGTRPS